MIQNPITFVISNNGTILDAQRGTIRALSNYASKIYLVAPFESVSIKVNYLIYDVKREVISQYLAPTSLLGKDVLDPTNPQYQTAGEWQVWEVSISQRALHRIAKYRAGRVGVSFQVNTIGIPSQVANGDYLGVLKTGSVLPNPASYSGTNGDHYIVDQYNYTDQYVTGDLTKGDYVYFKQVIVDSVITSKQWLKGQNIQQVAMTTTTDLAVDPSLLAELPEDFTEPEELTNFINDLIGDVADLHTTINGHIGNLDDPHDVQANQVTTQGFGLGESNVQDDIISLAVQITGIQVGDTDITYDNSNDDIIDEVTVAGAIGQLDSALYTHLQDQDDPHNTQASQVNTTANISVQTALDNLEADKVEKSPSLYTNILGESDKVYVKVGNDEKLVTLTNLRQSIIDDVVAFGYVIFTAKDEDGQPIIASPQTNKIYLFNPSDSNIANDQYEEWIYLDGVFELIGTTGIALDDYDTSVEVDAKVLSAKQSQYFYGKASANITKGQAIMLTGQVDDYITFAPATAAGIQFQEELFVGIAHENIASGDFGYVTWFGYITDVNLGFTAGSILYVNTNDSATAGTLVSSPPSADKGIVQAAAVVKNGASNTLLVRPKFISREIDDVDGLQSALDGKSNVGHSHVISDVTNLQGTLDNKEPADPNIQLHIVNSTIHYTQSAISITKSQVSDFAHTHAIADVTNLQTSLDGKVVKTGDTMTGELVVPSIVIGTWRIIPDEDSATLNFEVV